MQLPKLGSLQAAPAAAAAAGQTPSACCLHAATGAPRAQLPLFISGVFFVTGCILMAAANTITLLVVGRIFLGVGVGLSALVGPS